MNKPVTVTHLSQVLEPGGNRTYVTSTYNTTYQRPAAVQAQGVARAAYSMDLGYTAAIAGKHCRCQHGCCTCCGCQHGCCACCVRPASCKPLLFAACCVCGKQSRRADSSMRDSMLGFHDAVRAKQEGAWQGSWGAQPGGIPVTAPLLPCRRVSMGLQQRRQRVGLQLVH